jgi:hypothetical protein
LDHLLLGIHAALHPMTNRKRKILKKEKTLMNG